MITSESMHPTVLNQLGKFQLIVIKIGGSVLAEIPESFFLDITLLLQKGWFPVIVHGGGPSITNMLQKLGIESSFINGLRVTNKETLDVVQMVLNGKENMEIVKRLQQAGGKSIGLNGIDNFTIIAEPLDSKLGYVGKVKEVDTALFNMLLANGIIPVVSPLGVDQMGQIYNINADTVAQAIAVKMQAKMLCMISNVPGIYYQTANGEKIILHKLTIEDIQQLKETQQISGGMIPKLEAVVQCLEEGIDEIAIFDGREEGILAKVFDHQLVGTRILKTEVVS